MISQPPSLADALQCHRSGQLDAAAGIYREILTAAPQNADARHLLGLVALQAGDYEQAIHQIQRAIRLNSRAAVFHSNLGVAFQSLKRLDDAIASFRRAIKLASNYSEARNNLGIALREQGKVHEAIEVWRRAVALQPDYVDAWSNLAITLRQLGNAAESIACLRQIVRLMPNRADHFNNLGTALHEQGELDEAITCYRRAIELEPTFVLPQNNLGNALQEKEHFVEACACYERAIELHPDFAEAHVGLASALNELGYCQRAIKHNLAAIRVMPNPAAAECNLGILMAEQGDFSAAEKFFRAAIASDARYTGAHAELANLLRARLPEKDLAAQELLLLDSSLTYEQRAALHFGIAQVFDARGAYAEAAEHSTVANSLRLTQSRIAGQDYDPAIHSRFVDRIVEEFTPEFFARTCDFGSPSERPIFVVGLPRSGTTLIEQILARHSQVYGAGELRLAANAFDAACLSETNLGIKRPALDRDSMQRLALEHLEELHRRNATALRVVDKMPDNYLYLGFLAALFPRARFIHCRRDLRDVAVSCWMSNFRKVRWANDPPHIAARFHDYQRIMERWREVLPSPLLDVSYEDLVSDLETSARRLVAWCGLEWEPGCLEFYRNQGPVRTASSVQVRQPLYRSSVGRWRHYEHTSLAQLLNDLPVAS